MKILLGLALIFLGSSLHAQKQELPPMKPAKPNQKIETGESLEALDKRMTRKASYKFLVSQDMKCEMDPRKTKIICIQSGFGGGVVYEFQRTKPQVVESPYDSHHKNTPRTEGKVLNIPQPPKSIKEKLLNKAKSE